jgi:hypothetical protein
MQSAEQQQRRERRVVNTDARPTGRQTYAIARALAEIAGIDWPETRAAASDLISHLNDQRAAVAPGADNAPF